MWAGTPDGHPHGHHAYPCARSPRKNRNTLRQNEIWAMYSLPLDYTTAARHCVLRSTTHLTGYARISEPVQRAILEILCQKTLEGNTGPVLLHRRAAALCVSLPVVGNARPGTCPHSLASGTFLQLPCLGSSRGRVLPSFLKTLKVLSTSPPPPPGLRPLEDQSRPSCPLGLTRSFSSIRIIFHHYLYFGEQIWPHY